MGVTSSELWAPDVTYQILFTTPNKVKFEQPFKGWDTFCHPIDNAVVAYFTEKRMHKILLLKQQGTRTVAKFRCNAMV